MGTPVRRTNRMHTPNRYRTIWLSDVHLGTRACKAEFLLDFLRHNESDYLYLVGDVVDGWALSRSWYWDDHHNTIVQKLLRKARKGTRVVYVPGNHDEFARDFLGLRFGEIAVMKEALHTTTDGRQLLVLHGDVFDGVLYANCGDWVESCTALVEHLDGHLEIVRWVTIDHDTRLPGRTALSGDGLSQQPAVAARTGTALHHPA